MDIAQQWCVEYLDDQEFYSFDMLNKALEDQSDFINDRRPYRGQDISRRQLFEDHEQQLLRPLPDRRWSWSRWKKSKVAMNYHIRIANHWYSVPWKLMETGAAQGTVVRVPQSMLSTLSAKSMINAMVREDTSLAHATGSWFKEFVKPGQIQWSRRKRDGPCYCYIFQFRPVQSISIVGPQRSRKEKEMNRHKSNKSLKLSKLLSALLSTTAIAFPYLFPSIFPEGTMPYYIITVPIGVAAGVLAYKSQSWLLVAFSILAGLSPLLFAWIIWVVIGIIYFITGGRFPSAEWL